MAYPQADPACLNLMPRERSIGNEDWRARQSAMEAWYAALALDGSAQLSMFVSDYERIAPELRDLEGPTLDLGGGVGVTRHYLPTSMEYLVVDPGSGWLTMDRTALSARFPSLASLPPFVLGIGEKLPLRKASVRTVLGLWCLNHAEVPALVIAEAARVLEPGGQLVLVLEDMEPSWRDVLRWSQGRGRRRGALRTALRKLLRPFGGSWPLQPDHVAISENSLKEWAAPYFDPVRRTWRGEYLTLVMRRR